MQHPYIISTRRAQGLSMSLNRRRRHGSHRAALALVASLLTALIATCVVMTTR